MGKPLALLVEHDTDLRDIFRTALEEAGYAVQVAADAGDVPGNFDPSERPFLVLLDGEYESPEAVRRLADGLRSFEHFTVYISPDLNTALRCAGRTDHSLTLTKPVTFTQLRELAGQMRKELCGADD